MALTLRDHEHWLEDDRDCTLGQILQHLGKTLLEALLEIQCYATSNLRDFAWVEKLTCIVVPKGMYTNQKILEHTIVSLLKPNFPYAAVSYCCDPPSPDAQLPSTYQIKAVGSATPRPAAIRDQVLSRAIRFSQSHQLHGFWIDNECLDKRDTATYYKAMNGMDLVYRKCRVTCGLLESGIYNSKALRLLDQFLQNKFVDGNKARALIRIDPAVSPRRLQRLIYLLNQILADCWWERCWIFQENYCSGKRMKLLLPSDTSTKKTPHSASIKYVGNDVEISAAQFQASLTVICLAILRRGGSPQAHLRNTCDVMLRKASRYCVLWNFRGWDIVGTKNSPMSAVICADICVRKLKVPADIPAVVANCCDYTIRIDTTHKCVRGMSLSLILLTLFLLNGDMLAYHPRFKEPRAMTTCEFLLQYSIGHNIVPVISKELTFLKRRRWPSVELREHGIQTYGHFWTVNQAITTKSVPRARHFDNVKTKKLLTPFERARLRQLAETLEQAHPTLANQILRYLAEVANLISPYSQRTFMMRIMAKKICSAMKRKRQLLLGISRSSQSHQAIFVDTRSDVNRPLNVITCWENGQSIKHTNSVRTVEKFVSVEVKRDMESRVERWIPQGWIHGLYFAYGTSQDAFLLSWPTDLQTMF